MGFWDAIRRCLTAPASCAGRSGRHEFWWFALAVAATFALALAASAIDPVLGQALFAAGILTLVPLTAVTVRRLHDTGRSGSTILLGLIPLVGQAALIWLLTRRGEPGANRFGDDPRSDFWIAAA